MTVEAIQISTTPVFQKNAHAYEAGYPIICNEGGSRSSKSYSIVQLLCGMAKKTKGLRISIVSHSLPHIKRGAYRDFKQIMQDIGWWKEDEWRATDFVYTFSNGSYIELFGLEDEGKARGPGRDILFVNEANLISKTLFDQLAMRTTGKIFLDWNPADFNSWVYDLADDPKNKRIHSTYKDNIHNLTKAQIDYIESYRNLPDDFMWKVYGLGQRGAAKELIYTQWKYYENPPHSGDTFYGLDFGYTNPSAMVKVTNYEGANYVEEVLYKSSLTVPEMINHLKQIVKPNEVIYGDAAEPKTIEEIYKAGFNIKPSDKDVWAGIVGVKSYPLHIKAGSDNLVSELQSYKWEKDKNDNVLEEPVKANDHLCFDGDTLIITSAGYKPIRDIQPGDMVMTSQGFRSVKKLFNNGYQEICEYLIETPNFIAAVRVTPDHLIKVGDTWIPISQLQQGDMVSLPKSLTTDGLPFIETRNTIVLDPYLCTGTYGKQSTAQSLKERTYTTRTATETTTTLATLNSKQDSSTKATTLRSVLKMILNGLRNFRLKESQPLPNGTSRRLALSGIKDTPQSKALVSSPTENMGARYAAIRSYERSKIKSFAQTVVSHNTVGMSEPIQLRGLANTVSEPILSTSTREESFVQQAAVLNIVGDYVGKREVFDIEVEDVHEYFANGLLVHNCDAMRYAIFTHLTKPNSWWSA